MHLEALTVCFDQEASPFAPFDLKTEPGECVLTLLGRSVRQPSMAIHELNSQYPGGGGTVPDLTAISICTASAPDRAALSIIRQGLHVGRPPF